MTASKCPEKKRGDRDQSNILFGLDTRRYETYPGNLSLLIKSEISQFVLIKKNNKHRGDEHRKEI